MATTVTQIITETRLDPSIPFYEHSAEEMTYKTSVMIDSGRVLSEEITVSENQLDRITVTKFKSYDDRKVIFKDAGLIDINSRNIQHNRANAITVVRTSYEGDDASLATNSDRMVARFSSSDPFCISATDKEHWKDTLGAIGVKIDPVTGMHNGYDDLLEVSDLVPVGDFVFDDENKMVVLDGSGYFVTANLNTSEFSEINLIEKSFFVSFVPDQDSFTGKRYLLSKFSKDSGKGWYLCFEADGSICLQISGDSTSKTYVTPAGSVVPGQLNTVGFTAHFSNLENTVKIFCNGSEQISDSQGFDQSTNANLLTVGSGGNTEQSFMGKLLGIRVYYRTLEESEFNVLHRLFVKQLEN